MIVVVGCAVFILMFAFFVVDEDDIFPDDGAVA